MKDQLKLLTELQRHDARIQELEGMAKAFPAKLEAMHADVKRVEGMLERERTQLTDTESWRRRQEGSTRRSWWMPMAAWRSIMLYLKPHSTTW